MATQQRRRKRWPVYIAAGFLASAALVPGLGHTAGATETEEVARPPAPTVPVPTTPAPSASSQSAPVPLAPVPAVPSATASIAPLAPLAPLVQPAPRPAFGAYLHYGPRGVARMARFSQWLNGAQVRVGHTYLPGDRWSNIEGDPSFLDAWAAWRRGSQDRMLVLNVPMLERNEEGVPDAEVRALLQRGAAGDFDAHYRRLAERLVELKVPDTIVVLGWEMNGSTYTHRCGPDPAAWKTYWNRIVTVMRSVTGQQFRFDFTPSRGLDAIPWTECYPGDGTVDIIGMDTYDQPRGMSFDGQVTEPYGLQHHVDFAKAHGKPISYPEWGLFRNGDNAEYMRRMLAWIDAQQPVYHTITDYCPHGMWQCRRNPRAAQVYRAALSNPAWPVPLPTFEPPAVPLPGRECEWMDLGDWVEYWTGRRLCVRFDWWSRLW